VRVADADFQRRRVARGIRGCRFECEPTGHREVDVRRDVTRFVAQRLFAGASRLLDLVTIERVESHPSLHERAEWRELRFKGAGHHLPVDLLHRRDEPIAYAGYRFDVCLIAAAVAQGFADTHD
jgi:hypothetical protein